MIKLGLVVFTFPYLKGCVDFCVSTVSKKMYGVVVGVRKARVQT